MQYDYSFLMIWDPCILRGWLDSDDKYEKYNSTPLVIELATTLIEVREPLELMR